MRSMWKGGISFGLVMIPVRLYAATEQKDIAFRQVHRADGGRIRFRRFCLYVAKKSLMRMLLRVTNCRRVRWSCWTTRTSPICRSRRLSP